MKLEFIILTRFIFQISSFVTTVITAGLLIANPGLFLLPVLWKVSFPLTVALISGMIIILTDTKREHLDLMKYAALVLLSVAVVCVVLWVSAN